MIIITQFFLKINNKITKNNQKRKKEKKKKKEMITEKKLSFPSMTKPVFCRK